MKVAIVGSRSGENYPVDEIMRRIPPECKQIISGGAAGIDSLAELAAKKRGIPFIKIIPDYEKYGKYAPIKRNREIAERADLVLAFWDYHSRGTASILADCVELRVPFEVFGVEEKDRESV